MKLPGRWAILFAVIFSMGLLAGCELDSSSGDDDDNSNAGGGGRKKVVGSWRVVTDWRWSQMTFKADGTRSVVERSTGKTYTRGTWHLDDGKLVVVSDVTEEWDYTITGTTMNATLPSGNKIQMVKIN